ncbi:hypothetical protein DSO57_1014537 [Entomophthora muscae]|uniref:Uncharacterized protein n=1 Tax=Entomophthora muscae TaxID=34485 RepID=A0ACC2U3M7_9FUNG|nr:hypothetical protein DSO57_1014537 [Entomophthora muscae]
MPDPCIVMLTDQVATLQVNIEYLRQRLSDPDDYSSESDGKGEAEVTGTPTHFDHGCCPGLEGQPHVNCALALDHLAAVKNDVADRQDVPERKLQNLSCLTETINRQVTPLAAQTTSLVTCINGVAGTLAVQKIKIKEFGAAATTAWDISRQNSSTLDTLEESLKILWARQSAAESEFQNNPHIKILNLGDNSQSTSLSFDPNYKPTFKQIFDPKPSTVVIHMCAALQARADLASNKDNMLKSDNVWLAGDAVN